MTDPVFDTREALEAWRKETQAKYARMSRLANPIAIAAMGSALIRRVTAAHQHLKETPRHD